MVLLKSTNHPLIDLKPQSGFLKVRKDEVLSSLNTKGGNVNDT